MEEEGRVRERVRERTRAVFYAGVFIILGIIAFRLYGLPAIENASVTEIKVEILGFPLISRIDGETSTTVRLRMVDTDEIIRMKFKAEFLEWGQAASEKWSGKPYLDKVYVNNNEIGEGNIYQITYQGLWGAKKILSMQLLRSREELVREMAESKEMPLVGDWQKDWDITTIFDEYRLDFIQKFSRPGAYITGRVFYDISATPDARKAVQLFYFNSRKETIAVNIWIKEGDQWKFYQGGGNIYIVGVHQEDGSVEFELRGE